MGGSVTFKVSYLEDKSCLTDVQEVNFEGCTPKCHELKSKIAEIFGIELESFEILCGTRCLKYQEHNDINDVGLRSGMKLYAIPIKKVKKEEKLDPPVYSEVRNAIYGLSTLVGRSLRTKPAFKAALEKIMDDVIKTTAGVKEDETALDVLRNFRVFEAILDPKNTDRIINQHPALGRALIAMWISCSVQKVGNLDTNGDASISDHNSMDVDDSYYPIRTQQQPTTSRNTLRTITSSQLSAALQQTFSSSSAPSSIPPIPVVQSDSSNASLTAPNENTPGRSSQRNILTPEAMQQALMSTGLQHISDSLRSEEASGGTNFSVNEDIMKSGLDALRAMGITDEEACRQALIASQGNVEGAINIIFGGP